MDAEEITALMVQAAAAALAICPFILLVVWLVRRSARREERAFYDFVRRCQQGTK